LPRLCHVNTLVHIIGPTLWVENGIFVIMSGKIDVTTSFLSALGAKPWHLFPATILHISGAPLKTD